MGQYGPGHISRDQADGRSLNPRVSRVQSYRYGRDEPTPRRGCSVLPAIPTICSGGHTEVRTKRCRLSADSGGAAMVHHRMLPGPQRHLEDRECRCSAQRAPLGIGYAGGGGLQLQPRPAIGISEGGGDRNGTDRCEIRRHVEPLPPAMAPMVTGREGVEHGPGGEGGAVPDGLHPGDR